MRIVVIDGMGGGIGAQLVARLKEQLPAETEILALGATSTATERMLRAGAARGASGENAVRVTAPSADVIIAPIGAVIPNSMLGEITPAMAEAVMAAPAVKLLVPVVQPHFVVLGLEPRPLAALIDQAVALVRERLRPTV